MPRRYYSSTAQRTTLSAGINASVTSMSVGAVTGFPSSFPYTLILDQDTLSEEIVEVSARSGTTLTVTRGVDGSTAVAHTAGATVNHGVSARDFNEPNVFLNEGGTIAAPVLISASSSGNAFEVRQLGAGNAFVVEDSTNPDSTPFVIDASGNVGVGTGSPASLVHVDGGTITSQRYASAGNITLRRANGTASSPSAVLAGELTGSVVNRAYDGVSTYRDIGGMYFYANQNVSASQSGGGIYFSITPDGSTTPTERMRIDSAGRVGIGVAASHKLDVFDNTNSIARIFSNGNAQLNISRYSTDATAPLFLFEKYRGSTGGVTALTNGDNIGEIQWNAFDGTNGFAGTLIKSTVDGAVSTNVVPTRLTFFTTSGNTITERMRIDSNGNVGIGTSSPASLLHVSGPAGSGVASTRATFTNPSTTDWAYGELRFAVAGADRASIFGQRVSNGNGGRLSFLTTDTSGTSNERMVLDDAGLITGSGTSLGAWTAYTPTLGGTGWAIGNGTIDAVYCQIGKIVHFRLRVTFGSTSTFGASANPTLSLPVTSKTSQANNIIPCATVRDVSAGISYLCTTAYESTTVISLRSIGASGQLTSLTATSLFTWASTDLMDVSGTYEAA